MRQKLRQKNELSFSMKIILKASESVFHRNQKIQITRNFMMIRISNIIRPRFFSTSALVRNSVAKSSCPAGTKLNLKIRKNGDEPVALEDSEYPEWLWDMLDKKKTDAKLKETDIMRWRRKQLGKENAKKIKSNNFLANVK